MPRPEARCVFPKLPRIVQEIKFSPLSVPNLLALRDARGETSPSEGTFRNMCRYELIERRTAEQFLGTVEQHRLGLNLPQLGNDAILEFDTYIHYFQAAIDHFRSCNKNDPYTNPEELIAANAAYDIDVISDLKKNRLVPYKTAAEILGHAEGIIPRYRGVMRLVTVQPPRGEFSPVGARETRVGVIARFS